MKKKYFLLWIVLFGLYNSYSQTRLVNKAEKEFNQQAYASVNSGNLYDLLLENEYSSSAVYAKLGDSYYFNGDYKNALKAYSQILKQKDNYSFSNEQLFRYAQSLKSGGRYDEAAKIIKDLNAKIGKETINPNVDYLNDIKKQSDNYSIKLVSINSRMPDYGIAYYKENQVIFTSARDTTVSKKYKDAWTGKPYFKLYEATITSEGDLIDAKKLPGKINSVYHQSTPVITNDGNQMYFTRSNFLGNKFKTDDTKTNRLRIYRATLVNGIWDKIEDLSINNDAFSNAHPALTPDGKKLIFASDRPGSLGQTDLYEVEIKGDGTFGEVKNMGSSINTIGRETFPFVTKSGQLYFSSDGQPGLGGLDVFAAFKNNDTNYSLVNLGEPVNSTGDDFGFVINTDTKKGFFSSNRTNDDQIYSTKELVPVKRNDNLTILGKVYDEKTGDLLPKVKVTVYQINGLDSVSDEGGTDSDNIDDSTGTTGNNKKGKNPKGSKDSKNTKNSKTAKNSGKAAREKSIDEAIAKGKKVDEFYTDNAGEYLLKVPAGEYILTYEKEGYTFSNRDHIIAKEGENKTIIFDNRLKADPDAIQLHNEDNKVITNGSDLTKTLDLEPIYFDLNGSKVKKTSLKELNKVVQLLKDYPLMTIDIRSHTDSQGDNSYNLKLSERRAQSTMQYLRTKGIRSARITGRGYGETEIINECVDGVKCSSMQHQVNRRSEFIISFNNK